MGSRSMVLLLLMHVMLTTTGLLLHLKAHDPSRSLFFWWAAPVSFFNLLVVTALYLNPRTVAWGVLFNGMTVAIGIIGMSYYSVKTLPPPYSAGRLLVHSTLPYCLLLLAKLPLAFLILSEAGNRNARG